jgi:hypothetical protein
VLFTYMLKIYLSKIHPLHCSPFPLLTDFTLLFSYVNVKHIHHVHPHSFFMSAPCHLYPPQEKIYFTFLSFFFFKVYIDSPREFHLGTLGLYGLRFNQTSPFHYFLFLCHHAAHYSTAYSILYCIIFTCRWVVSIFFIC